jgi:hypothetical protein
MLCQLHGLKWDTFKHKAETVVLLIINNKNYVHFQHKNAHKVHFERPTSKQWSPYGCHYYPDPKAFPQPNLDSLPHEPLKKGEQYYLDLAGNICKVCSFTPHHIIPSYGHSTAYVHNAEKYINDNL